MIKRPIHHKSVIIVHFYYTFYVPVVSRMLLPKVVHTQIPQFHEYIILHGERDFADVLKVMGKEVRDSPSTGRILDDVVNPKIGDHVQELKRGLSTLKLTASEGMETSFLQLEGFNSVYICDRVWKSILPRASTKTSTG